MPSPTPLQNEIIALDLTLPSPAQNLACDEALLDQAELGGGPGILRFWESPDFFVVLGYANRWTEEVKTAACREENIPVLRRCSGGHRRAQPQRAEACGPPDRRRP